VLLTAPDADQPLPLSGQTRITVRRGGVNVRQTPSLQSERLGEMPEGTTRTVRSLIFSDFTWLGTGWPQESDAVRAWIAGEFTDFPRSTAYSQVSGAWYESRAMLSFRRTLARDLLRVRGADQTRLDQVGTLRDPELRDLEQTLTAPTVPASVVKFGQLRAALGLPDPFEYLPVHTSPPAKLDTLTFEGFGPNSFAFDNWPVYYEATRGMHPGVDYDVAEGSPLIAVADGQIVPFAFLGDPAEESIALRPYLPDAYRQPDGSRVLSNVIVGYGHLTGDPTSRLVRPGEVVKAGQIIGTSGWPVYTRDDGSVGIQGNNAHLHLEVHLVTDGQRNLGSRTPFNPLLFWSPRLVAWQARLAARPPYPASGQPWGRLGFFSVGCYSYEPSGIVWNYSPTRDMPWPQGVYDVDGMLQYVQTFGAYPLDGSSRF
jgi:murein DD-endopeptidase MepM/ murein hydrolase activator NlpD